MKDVPVRWQNGRPIVAIYYLVNYHILNYRGLIVHLNQVNQPVGVVADSSGCLVVAVVDVDVDVDVDETLMWELGLAGRLGKLSRTEENLLL
jgi:hypothetical protein